MCTVVYDLARTCHSTCLEEIYAKAVTAINTMLRTYSIAVEILDAALCNIVFWKAGNELSLDTIVCKRYRHISLTATESGFKLFSL